MSWNCSYKANIYTQPIVPHTEETARVNGITVEDLLRQNFPLSDKNVCFITGRICPGRIDQCDAQITLSQIETEFKTFMREHLYDRPNLAHVMLKYFCQSVKPMVKFIDNQYIMRLIGTQEALGLLQILVAELALRRGETEDWVLTPQPAFAVNLEQYPKNYHQAVTMQIIPPIFGEQALEPDSSVLNMTREQR